MDKWTKGWTNSVGLCPLLGCCLKMKHLSFPQTSSFQSSNSFMKWIIHVFSCKLQLFKRVCPPISWWVRWLVGPLVGRSVGHALFLSAKNDWLTCSRSLGRCLACVQDPQTWTLIHTHNHWTHLRSICNYWLRAGLVLISSNLRKIEGRTILLQENLLKSLLNHLYLF